MNDDTLIRLENLRALNLSPTHLSEKVGGRVSYWADMLRGKKSFGEKAARKLEEGLGLPRGALDQQRDDGEPPIALPKASPQVFVSHAEGDVERMFLLMASLLNSVDELTRVQAESLVTRLFDGNADAGNIARRLDLLLSPGNKVGKESTPGIVAVVVEEGRQSNGTSDRVEKQDRSAGAGGRTRTPARVGKVR